MSEIVKKAWQKYLKQLQLHPLRTKAITASVLIGSNYVIAQKIAGVKKLPLRKLLLMMLYGAYAGPFGHFHHKLIETMVEGKKGKETVAKRVLLEQLSSPWNNFLFMVYYGVVVEGRPWSSVKSKIREDFPSVQLASWKFWPVVGWVNHQYIPFQL